MDLCFAGAGRLATQLARALAEKGGHRITAVYSRTTDAARTLADSVGAEAAASVAALCAHTADAIIIAVSDDAIATVAEQIAREERKRNADGEGTSACRPVFHTAGSVPMSVLQHMAHHGVIYPMQTFSKERKVDFSRVTFFTEASDGDTLAVAHSIAASVSGRVATLDSDRRRYLHLAAVFAGNFANHCYTLAADIVERCGLDFTVMLPLIEETAAKVETMHPREAQTGPAVRHDTNVMQRQRELLGEEKMAQQIYTLMSESIHRHSL